MTISLKTTSGKILASAALLGTAAAVAGMGTFGGFTSTTSASTAVDTATTVIGLDGHNAVGGLSIGATGMLPGDRAERLVTISNLGTADLGSVTLGSAPAAANALGADKVNGLNLTVESCATAWTATPSTGFSCAPGAVQILTGLPIAGSSTLGNLASLTAGKSDNLKITVALPKGADNTFQGLKNSIDFTFDATQRSTPAFK
ncbi:MAG TPA: hypothetical protein VF885_10355 [Arthrobacter sp.]